VSSSFPVPSQACPLSLEQLVSPTLQASNMHLDQAPCLSYQPRPQALSYQPHPEADRIEQVWRSSARTCSGYTNGVQSGNGSLSESTCSGEESDDNISTKQSKTMMICNIPCRLSEADVIGAIHSVGFAGTYDFVYLPDNRRHGTRSAKRCTVKYADDQGFNANDGPSGQSSKVNRLAQYLRALR